MAYRVLVASALVPASLSTGRPDLGSRHCCTKIPKRDLQAKSNQDSFIGLAKTIYPQKRLAGKEKPRLNSRVGQNHIYTV